LATYTPENSAGLGNKQMLEYILNGRDPQKLIDAFCTNWIAPASRYEHSTINVEKRYDV
jgi:hypothetical protein